MPSARPVRWLHRLALFCCWAACSWALDLSLVNNSPFLPPGFQPPGGATATAAPPPQAAQLEYRGVYELGGQLHFNVFDKRTARGTWMRTGEENEGARVVDYDLDEDVVVVEYNGARMRLSLIETSTTPIPVMGAPTSQPAQAALQQPGQQDQQVRTSIPVRRRIIRPGSNATTTSERRPVIPPRPANP